MPETLKQVVDRVKAAKTAIGNAIVAKGGTVNQGDGLEEYPADIATIPTGGITPAEPKDVNFYDYDGTCLYSYTADEFAELTAMPANPSHDGLTAQGWNIVLSDAKTWVAANTYLDIGQNYITSDGKTRIYIYLNSGGLEPYLTLYLSDDSEVDVDWGDGSTHSTFTSTTADYVSEKHTYSTAGSYAIAITVISGSFTIQSPYSFSYLLSDNKSTSQSSNQYYMQSVQCVEIGEDCYVGDCAFAALRCLKTVSIPKLSGWGNSVWNSCGSLRIIIPPISMVWGNRAVINCASLMCVPKIVDTSNYRLYEDCVSLEKVFFDTTLGGSALWGCYSVKNVVISDNVTSMFSDALKNAYAIDTISIPSGFSSLGSSIFSSCYSLKTIIVNKAEDSILGAPWGAPNATVVWTG